MCDGRFIVSREGQGRTGGLTESDVRELRVPWLDLGLFVGAALAFWWFV